MWQMDHNNGRFCEKIVCGVNGNSILSLQFFCKSKFILK